MPDQVRTIIHRHETAWMGALSDEELRAYIALLHQIQDSIAAAVARRPRICATPPKVTSYLSPRTRCHPGRHALSGPMPLDSVGAPSYAATGRPAAMLCRDLVPDELEVVTVDSWTPARSRPTPALPRALASIGMGLVFAVGCGSAAPMAQPATSPRASATAPTTQATPADAAQGQIPPGREISEGGGGPVQYTFREEWRRALAQAQTWRSRAYLIGGAGDMVNDDGVPSHWSLIFIDRTDADAVLLVEIDPWGKVSQTREVTGDGVGSFVDKYTKPIPYEVIDSDAAVGLGKAALVSRVDMAKTKDPRIDLGFSVLDGSGPTWSYTVFSTSRVEYVTAHVDALTGDVAPPE